MALVRSSAERPTKFENCRELLLALLEVVLADVAALGLAFGKFFVSAFLVRVLVVFRDFGILFAAFFLARDDFVNDRDDFVGLRLTQREHLAAGQRCGIDIDAINHVLDDLQDCPGG